MLQCRALSDDQLIMGHKNEALLKLDLFETPLKLNIFQLIEWHRSRDWVLISIQWIDAHELKNGNVHARETLSVRVRN